jgi:hypothetical protein
MLRLTLRRVLIHATWQRRFPGVGVLAFADHSYLINLGLSDTKAPFLTIGWYRFRPDFLEFDRTQRGPWHFSESSRFRRMSHQFQAATTGRELTAAEQELAE